MCISASEPSISPNFQALDAEITFKSSDGILFHIHKANLVACSESFTPPENSTFDEIVPLTEDSATLELLFQFIYPQPNPDLDQLKFEELALLAEAAEKYRVFPAMNLCAICMERPDHLKAHAEEILQHALKHNIRTLASRAALLLLDRPLDGFVQILPYHVVIPWNPSVAVSIPSCCPTAARNLVAKLTTEVSLIPTFADFALSNNEEVIPPHDKSFGSLISSMKYLKETSSAEPVEPKVNIWKASESRITFLCRDNASLTVPLATIRGWSKALLPTQYIQPIRLPETSNTINLLFKFLDRAPHPDLEGLNFDVLGPLSLAADLYEVFPAIFMTVGLVSCRRALGRGDLDAHPTAVMHYAIGSRNYQLMDTAARLVLLKSPVDIVQMIGNKNALVSWFRYVEEWNKVLRFASDFSKNRRIKKYDGLYSRPRRVCQGCEDSNVDTPTVMVLAKLNDGVKSLLDLDNTFTISVPLCCSTSRGDIELWKTTITSSIQSIPSFSSIFQKSILPTAKVLRFFTILTQMSDDLGTPVSEPVSQKFNDLDAEIVFKSSDGILFRIHKLNLRACTEAFSPPENTTFDEIVALTETSSTLELLFRFIYPLPQPNFGELDFESLVLVAEAAEKYRVFPAMNLSWSAKVRYHSHWTRVWKSALSSAAAEDMSQNCSDCQKNALTYLSSAQLSSLEKISTHLVPCEGCVSTLLPSDSDIKSLVSTLKNEMIWIPTFADFAFPDTAQPTEQELPESESTNPVQVQLVGQRGRQTATTPRARMVTIVTAAASTEDLDVSKITFLSSDGVSFVVVLASIQALSKNLLPSQYGETVPLPESSTTLRLLFEFLGISPPDLDGLNFDILGPLSLAADLYQIFPAISVCFIRREHALKRGNLSKHTTAIMHYAVRAKNYDLMNQAAPLLVGHSPAEMVRLIDDMNVVVSWQLSQ
ncbi:hypothetical protein H0H93_004853 [Arthromyces matolae]|nr:hypothetical protein H0H93_004853 [Arthromyces matolae]